MPLTTPSAGRHRGKGAVVVSLLMLGLYGCARTPSEPAPTVTPDHVRSHGENAFQKLKQEEQTRGADPAVPR
jgi:hypothetical protein